MDINVLLKQKSKARTGLIVFAILTGITWIINTILSLNVLAGIMELNSLKSSGTSAQELLIVSITLLFVSILLLALCVAFYLFVAFLIVNIVKLTKSSNAIKAIVAANPDATLPQEKDN